MKCIRKAPRGWKCKVEHDSIEGMQYGPCGLVPRWWNLADRWRYRRML